MKIIVVIHPSRNHKKLVLTRTDTNEVVALSERNLLGVSILKGYAKTLGFKLTKVEMEV